ncbi:MAG: hypothetical protein E6J56_24995, partial [Deltaproteobacteria bacterium]
MASQDTSRSPPRWGRANAGTSTPTEPRTSSRSPAADSSSGATTHTTTTTTTTTTIATTTTTTSTTTTTGGACSACTGGVPGHISFTTTVGTGQCGHLDADGAPNFFPLACGGLYFGGANVGVPLPSKVPDQGSSITNAACASGTTLTLTGASASETTGGTPPNNRCVQGLTTKLNTACLVNADCASTCTTTADCSPGAACNAGACSNAKCAQTRCTNAGCLFGPPLPIPNS